jgi:hypothetical protein
MIDVTGVASDNLERVLMELSIVDFVAATNESNSRVGDLQG